MPPCGGRAAPQLLGGERRSGHVRRGLPRDHRKGAWHEAEADNRGAGWSISTNGTAVIDTESKPTWSRGVLWVCHSMLGAVKGYSVRRPSVNAYGNAEPWVCLGYRREVSSRDG